MDTSDSSTNTSIDEDFFIIEDGDESLDGTGAIYIQENANDDQFGLLPYMYEPVLDEKDMVDFNEAHEDHLIERSGNKEWYITQIYFEFYLNHMVVIYVYL